MAQLGHSSPQVGSPQTIGSQSRDFHDVAIESLNSAGTDWLDTLDFGVVGIDRAGVTIRYNMVEARLAGIARDQVLGQEFFLTTGICMNNFMVAQRFEDEPMLDVTLDYVLTFRMRPTPVKLRLLQEPSSPLRYLLIHR